MGLDRAKGVQPRVVYTHEQRKAKRVAWEASYRQSELGRAARRRNDLKRHGITSEQYDALLAAQGGVCAVPGCDATEARSNVDRLCVDHDHSCCPGVWSCGKCVRGLICGPCNFALGNSGDSADRLRALADYIERPR